MFTLLTAADDRLGRYRVGYLGRRGVSRVAGVGLAGVTVQDGSPWLVLTNLTSI